MPVNQNRPFERHMVTNIPNLLAAGQPLSALAVGQLGIFDAKTNLSITAPTYQANKAIYFAQGTPDRSMFPEGAMVPNIYRRSHTIKGKSLISLRGARASRGRGEIVTLGYDGSDVSKTLTAKPGDTFYYWIRLTGDPIFNLNPDYQKGVIIQGAVSMPCASDCADNCTTVDCNTIADLIIKDLTPQPNDNDPLGVTGGKFLPGGQRLTDYVRVSKVSTCDQPTAFECFKQATLVVADNGTQSDLGLVQAYFPGVPIQVLDRTGIFTTYSTLVADSETAPADYISQPTFIAECNTCPVGSTFIPSTDQFQVLNGNNGPTDQSAAITAGLAGAGFTDVAVVLLQIDPLTNTATYQVNVTAGTANAAGITTVILALSIGGSVNTVFVGTVGSGCLLPPTTYSWTLSACEAVCTYLGNYTITLKDKVCGTCESSSASGGSDLTYFEELQKLYVDSGLASSLTVSDVGVNCTRKYTITVISLPGVVGCTVEDVVFPYVPGFNEQPWRFVGVIGVDPTNCSCGIQLESHFKPRLENECTFGYFVRQYDWVHIEISSHNPDWRSTDLCEVDPVATRIQNGAYPNGDGSAVVRIEKADRMYDMDYWYIEPNLREAFDYYFEARFDSYYDMVAVEFEFSYSSNAFFAQTDHDRYVQFFWLPEGTTGQLTTALNTYAASANINIDPVVL